MLEANIIQRITFKHIDFHNDLKQLIYGIYFQLLVHF